VLPVGEIRSVRLCREMVHALVLQQVTAPASGADAATATSALNLCRLVASSAACFVYAMELVHALLEKYAPAASASAPALSVVYRLHRVRDTVQSATFIDDWKLCHGDNVGEALGALASESRAKAVGTTTLAWWLQSRATAAAAPEAAQIQKLVLVVAKKRSVSDAQVAELHGLAQQLSAPGSGAFVAECLHLEPVAGVLVRRFMRHGGASSEDVAAQQLCTVIAAAYCHPSSALVPAGASAGCLQSEVEELLSATRAQCHELVNIVSTSMGTVHHVTTAIANKLHVATQDLLEGRLEVAVVSHCILEWIAANAQATTDRKAFSVGCFHALLQAYLSLVLGIFSTSGPLLQLECVSLLQLVLSPALAGELSASASMPHESEDLVRHCLTTLVHMLGLAGRQLGGGDAFVIERIFALIRSKLVLVEPVGACCVLSGCSPVDNHVCSRVWTLFCFVGYGSLLFPAVCGQPAAALRQQLPEQLVSAAAAAAEPLGAGQDAVHQPDHAGCAAVRGAVPRRGPVATALAGRGSELEGGGRGAAGRAEEVRQARVSAVAVSAPIYHSCALFLNFPDFHMK
jgi:hypothetical protein